MLYRAIIGFVPMVLFALIASGAIPLSGVVKTSEYRPEAAAGPTETDGKAGKDKEGKPYRARTAEGIVSQQIGVIPNDAIEMMEGNMEAVAKIHSEMKKYEDESRQEARTPGWKPKSSGWGRSE